jgi:hypothetical protein
VKIECKCHRHKCKVEIEGESGFNGTIPKDCILGYPIFSNFIEMKEK